jgi:branched-chain amino acid transport system substrate-binding protein
VSKTTAVWILVVLAGWPGSLCKAQPSSAGTPRPFRDFREQANAYAGPGRELADPKNVQEVLLGYFGPEDPDDPDGGDLWKAVELAVQKANAAGGFQGKPFRVLSAWSSSPWKAGVGRLARMAYLERVWAMIGGIDGPSAHLAEQVVAKARLPLVCPLCSDRSANVANVPWMFSTLPGDHLQAPVLVEGLLIQAGPRGFAILSDEDHDSRLFRGELERALRSQRAAPRFTHVLPSDGAGLTTIAAELVSEDVDAVVIAAGASRSAQIVQALGIAGFRGLIFGKHDMGRRRFLREAGDSAEGVIFPLPFDPEALSATFRAEFENRYHAQPDYAAAYAYDSVNLLVQAICRSGLNRARIGDAIRSLSPYPGVTGAIMWDKLGSNTCKVGLGTIRGGRVISFKPARRYPGFGNQ